MKLGILGPLTFEVDGTCCVPSAPKPRTALALLLLNINTVLPTATLINELWRDRPPASARTTLQTYVLQLRKLLPSRTAAVRASGENSILRTTMTGYRLEAPNDFVDVTWFDRWIAAGRLALEQGDDQGAANLFRRALGLWKGGAPFTDVVPGPVLEGATRRLEEDRLAVIDQCIETELRLGRHHELLGELAGLVTEYPLQENFHSHFMLALAQSGHRFKALEVFHVLRHTLVEELGMEPSARLQRLQQAILSATDTVVELPPTVSASHGKQKNIRQ